MFLYLFWFFLGCMAVAVQLRASDSGADGKHSTSGKTPPGFLAFRNNYLLVYSLAMGETQWCNNGVHGQRGSAANLDTDPCCAWAPRAWPLDSCCAQLRLLALLPSCSG